MEYAKVYYISIKGVGIRPIYAYSVWHAKDKAWTEYRNVQPNRLLYKSTYKKLKQNLNG